jgi:hypothetical protein
MSLQAISHELFSVCIHPGTVCRYRTLFCSLPLRPGAQYRLGNARDILQSFASESFGDLGQGGSLRVRQAEAGRQVSSEDAILGRQIFVSQQ